MTKLLKIIAFGLLAFAMTTISGIAHFSYAKPAAESLLSFVFLSVETAMSHGIAGILIAIVIFFIIKRSIQLLLTMTLILSVLAGILWYIW